MKHIGKELTWLKDSMREVIYEAMMTGDLSGAIVGQEARSQRDLCNSATLPIKYGDGNNKEEYMKELEKLGIQVTGTEDDLFYNVVLPEGWKIEPTDHYLWSHLVDAKGRKRASIFYKAAFYDRDAFLRFERRFSINREVDDYDRKLFELKPEFVQVGTEQVFVDEDGKPVSKNQIKQISYCEGFDEQPHCSAWISQKGKRSPWEASELRVVEKPVYKKNPEYVPLTGYEKYSQPFHAEVRDFDGTVIYRTKSVKTDFGHTDERHWEFFKHRDELLARIREECATWLQNNYPDWKSYSAYWD